MFTVVEERYFLNSVLV